MFWRQAWLVCVLLLWGGVASAQRVDCGALEGGCAAEAQRRWSSRDWGALRPLMEAACQEEGALHCARLSILVEGGLGGPQDKARALQLQDRACREAGPTHCQRAASLARQAQQPYDATEVIEGYAKNCDGRDLPFCVAVASLYEGGFGVTLDEGKARELHRLTCQRGHQAGCRRYAVALLRGQPDPALEAEARQILQQACHQPRTGPGACVGGQAQACYDLGVAVDEGLGGDAVPSHALALYDRACREDSALGCALAAQRRWEAPQSPADLQRARQLYDKLADKQGSLALQAAVVMQSNPHELPRPAYALTLMLQICERGNRSACAQAGVLAPRVQGPALERLRAALERDCEQEKLCKARDLLRLHTAGR